MERRIINGLSPFAGHLRRLFIRASGGRCETELFGKPRRNLLVCCQMPRLPNRTLPAPGVRVLAVINDELYLA
jgi:hypothetical protein